MIILNSQCITKYTLSLLILK